MRIGRNTAVVVLLLAMLIFSLAAPMGCGDSQREAPYPSLQGDEASFYGSLLQAVLSGLLKGAAGQAGSAAMGEIMELLGWGGGSGDKSVLDEMSKKLDKIIQILNDIRSTLQSLLLALNITEEEIIANTNDPTEAITNIRTSHQELQGLAKGKDPGTVDQTTLQNFTNRVENIFVIDKQINAIHDAILPPTIAKSPVLENYTNLGINRISQQSKRLTDAYLGLENYFSQLLYYQMEGVNLFVETKIYRKKAGLSQIDGMDAQEYMDFFIENELKPEVDNFMHNVHRIILSQVDLSDYDHFLPSDTPAILSRARFFGIQSLNENHFGLRGTLIATQDLVNNVISINAKNRQTGKLYSGAGTLHTVRGIKYDYWTDDRVKPSSDYTVISYDFGDAPVGNYDILDASGKAIGTAIVQMYKEDYTVDGSGTIRYGHFVIKDRIGNKARFVDSAPLWNYWTSNLKNASSDGDAHRRPVNLYGDNGSGDGTYHGHVELDGLFTADAGGTPQINVHYSVDISGQVESHYGEDFCPTAEMDYGIGVWDRTTGKFACIGSSKSVSVTHGKKSINDTASGVCTFGASEGHAYYLYISLNISDRNGREGYAKSKISIDKINHVFIDF